LIRQGKYERLDTKHASKRAEEVYKILVGIPKGRNVYRNAGHQDRRYYDGY